MPVGTAMPMNFAADPADESQAADASATPVTPLENDLRRLTELQRSYEFQKRRFLRVMSMVQGEFRALAGDQHLFFRAFVTKVEELTKALDEGGHVGHARFEKESEVVARLEEEAAALARKLQTKRLEARLVATASPLAAAAWAAGLDSREVDGAQRAYEEILKIETALARGVTIGEGEFLVTLTSTDTPTAATLARLYSALSTTFAAAGVSELAREDVRIGSYWEAFKGKLQRLKAFTQREEVQEAGRHVAKEAFDAATKGAGEKRKSDAEARKATVEAELAEIDARVKGDPDVVEYTKAAEKAKAVREILLMERERLELLARADALLQQATGPVRDQLLRSPLFRLTFDDGQNQFAVCCNDKFLFWEENRQVKRIAVREAPRAREVSGQEPAEEVA